MKVVHVMTATQGGAGIAAMRSHRALRTTGCDSHVLCLSGSADRGDEHVEVFPTHFVRFWERTAARAGIPLARPDRAARRRDRLGLHYISFSDPRSDYDLTDHPLIRSADVVHLHWVGGFLDWPSFFEKVGKPVVWTLHDMNPFLGGFHYECERLRASAEARMVDEELRKKKVAYLKTVQSLSIVCPSSWLAGKSSASEALGRFPHTVIRNCVDGRAFRPISRDTAREILDLPRQGKVLLTVAERPGDWRKGSDLLEAALGQLSTGEQFHWATAGDVAGFEGRSAQHLGPLNDSRLMALAYSAADFVVSSSREDNLPNVIVEALSVGTPVVALPAGGIPEMIQDGRNGVLAAAISSEALADALRHADEMTFDREAIRRDSMATYDPTLIANEYLTLYRSLLA